MLKLNLKHLFNERGITQPYTYLQKHGIPRHTARRILNGEHTHLHFHYIELLCEAFICTPNDLFEYIPAQQDTLAANHPLNNLKKEALDFSWLQSTANMPLQELHQLIRKVKEEIDQAPQTER
ncbi:MAG: hypothetical protein RLZ47_700 [Bacteroidota bacterium]|jgi:DNA-binding Xre family transcriptional regulator